MGGPEAQLVDVGDIPALDAIEQIEEVVLLLHDFLRAHLACAAQVAEADLLAITLVTAEPVVAARVAVRAAVAQRERDGRAADHGVIADPFGDVGDVALQFELFGGAAYQAEGCDEWQDS